MNSNWRIFRSPRLITLGIQITDDRLLKTDDKALKPNRSTGSSVKTNLRRKHDMFSVIPYGPLKICGSKTGEIFAQI